MGCNYRFPLPMVLSRLPISLAENRFWRPSSGGAKLHIEACCCCEVAAVFIRWSELYTKTLNHKSVARCEILWCNGRDARPETPYRIS